MYFYLIVVLIAIIFFVLIVVYLNYNITKTLTTVVYPPVENACPDFWLTDTLGRCLVPDADTPDGNLGTFLGPTINQKATQAPITYGYLNNNNHIKIDFNNVGWGTLGSSSVCSKKKWASTYGISWDGVSNYTGVCN